MYWSALDKVLKLLFAIPEKLVHIHYNYKHVLHTYIALLTANLSPTMAAHKIFHLVHFQHSQQHSTKLSIHDRFRKQNYVCTLIYVYVSLRIDKDLTQKINTSCCIKALIALL